MQDKPLLEESKQLTAKVVKKTHDQTFYELSELITIAPRNKRKLSDILEQEKKYVKDWAKEFVPEDGVKLICISDAHTHDERLVFPAIQVSKDGKTEYARLGLHIDGVMTMMIHGGDSQRMKPHEVYLRRIASVNGFTYKKA